jgi:hypothetical protein
MNAHHTNHRMNAALHPSVVHLQGCRCKAVSSSKGTPGVQAPGVSCFQLCVLYWVRLSVRTAGFHLAETGSIPVLSTKRISASVYVV